MLEAHIKTLETIRSEIQAQHAQSADAHLCNTAAALHNAITALKGHLAKPVKPAAAAKPETN